MPLIRSLVQRIVSSATFAKMEESSRRWMVRCLTCGAEWSIWEMGGLRWKAYPKEKRTVARCEKCRRYRRVLLYLKADEAVVGKEGT